MSLILALSPTNTLIAELPTSNGTRRKVNLSPNKISQTTIENAIKCLRSISNISIEKSKLNSTEDLSTIEITKILNEAVDQNAKILSELQSQIIRATEAANALSTILKEDNTALDTIYRILKAQLTNWVKISEDGNPTDQQIYHWEKHGTITDGKITPKNSFSDPMCAFCKSEGRFEPGKNREKAVKGLSENEALRLGLIYRGYKKSNPKDPTQWIRTNYPTCYLLPDGKVLDSKKIGWLKSHRDALIQDGKLHALNINFVPQDNKTHSHGGAKVKKLVKLIKQSSMPKSKISAKNLVAAF